MAPAPGPFLVVLTGGIASGKTAVSDRFSELGVPVVDTDRIARQLVEPGKPALDAIVAQFGAAILQPDGSLDRRALREQIFTDGAARKQLEAILHPAIREEATQQVWNSPGDYCVLVVPLLVRRDQYPGADRILVIDVSEETQLERLIQRDEVSRQQAQAALAAQISREQRLQLADDVISNEGSFDELKQAVDQQHARYLQMATSRN